MTIHELNNIMNIIFIGATVISLIISALAATKKNSNNFIFSVGFAGAAMMFALLGLYSNACYLEAASTNDTNMTHETVHKESEEKIVKDVEGNEYLITYDEDGEPIIIPIQ